MKNLTIKTLILSLSIFSVSNTECSGGFLVLAAGFLGLSCAVGAVVGVAVVGVIGGAIFLGSKAVKHVSSKINETSEERALRPFDELRGDQKDDRKKERKAEIKKKREAMKKRKREAREVRKNKRAENKKMRLAATV